ncbi:MAG TPA: GAF and ANTAR domain-containing protein [Catenuloplanes sp.]|jgi:transcriptional regulator with GAF, ATPase, and Fis domain
MAGDGADEARGRPSVSYTGPDSRLNDLAVILSDLARMFHEQQNVEDTLRGIVEAAVGTVPGAQHAALSMIESRRVVKTRAGTDDLVYRVDQAQYDSGEGPCLSALYDQRTVRLSNMAAETRWPGFTARAAALGVGSMLSFQLYAQQDNLGALNLYSADTDAFDDESEHVGLLFAAHAAVAVVDARQQQQMSHAMAVRDLIGQAKGILMERHKLTGDEAFALLVRASQHTNVKLHEVARELVETGELAHRDR